MRRLLSVLVRAFVAMVVGLIALAPLAMAAHVDGAFRATGKVDLGPEARHDASLVALFCVNTSGVQRLDLVAPQLHVVEYAKRQVDVQALTNHFSYRTQLDERSFDL